MKRILVTAGGTATAWHISQIVKKYFQDKIEIQVCDINDPMLVPTIVSAKKVHRVPPVNHENYVDAISKIIEKEDINYIIPLIPQEAFLFAADGDFICKQKIGTTAPKRKTTELLADKYNLFQTLDALAIPTPKLYNKEEIERKSQYLLKPRLGFGSIGLEIVTGQELIEKKVDKNTVIQEYCHENDYDEITVEIYNGKAGLHLFSRRRVATKAGVCVKMVPVDDSPFLPYIKKLVESVECPTAFNVQFLRDQGVWKLFDCNLRLGAGTALSTAIGFQLTRALLADMIGEKVNSNWLEIDKTAKAVLRVYDEIVIR